MENTGIDLSNLPSALTNLTNWYGDYAKEVVRHRAVPNIDGFKPSQRRLLFSMKEMEKVKGLTKSSSVVGTVLKLHPHGDTSAYDTLVRMVDKHMATSIPFVGGKGTFSKIFSTSPPAAMRYTEVTFTDIADELFGELSSTKLVLTEDGHYKEPLTLPVSFPNVLISPSSGIAVGLSSNIPANNFHDVINAAIELEQTGGIAKPLVPDYTTGGEIVYNEEELNKMMETGHARFKLRGTWRIQGKSIIIDSIPYYAKVNNIIDDAKKIQGVSSAKDLSDLKTTLGIEVICSNKGVVGQVLHELLRTTDLQMSMTTNIVVIINNQPRVIGAKELLAEWLIFRKKVISDDLQLKIGRVNREIARFEVFTDLLNNVDRRTEFTRTLVDKDANVARTLLQGWYTEAPKDTLDYILDLRMRQFSNYEGKMRTLNNLRKDKQDLEYSLENLSETVVNQLKEINTRYSIPRKTTVTDVDYDFSDYSSEVKQQAVPVIFAVDGKFIKKVQVSRLTEGLEGLRCMSDDVVSFIDDKGRLLRVDLNNLEFSSTNDRGVYLATYLNVEDDFEVVGHELIADKKMGYVYEDGYVSVIDYKEWFYGKRTTKITHKGLSESAGLIMGELNLDKPYIYLQTSKGRFGFFRSDFKQKHRTARTRLAFGIKNDEVITNVAELTFAEMSSLVTNALSYQERLYHLSAEDKFDNDVYVEHVN